MQLPSAAAEGPSVQAFAISSVGEESPRSADPAGAGLPNGAEALGGSSRSETVAQLNALHGRVASDAPASAPAAQPQSPAGRKGFASLTHRNGKPEANGHGKGASGAADAQTDGPERTKSKGSSWFGVKRGRQPRPGSAEAVRSPSLKAPRQVGPVVGGIPLVAGPLPGDARSSDEISCYSEDSSVRYESVSAPVSTVATPSGPPLLPLPPGSAEIPASGKRPGHSRHRSLLGSLGIKLAGRTRSIASAGSADLDAIEAEVNGGSSQACGEGRGGEHPPPRPTTPQDAAALALAPQPVLPPGTCGIANVGNSCFVGAAVQCLRFTPGLPLQLVPDLVEQAAAQEAEFEARVRTGLEAAWQGAGAANAAQRQRQEQVAAEPAAGVEAPQKAEAADADAPPAAAIQPAEEQQGSSQATAAATELSNADASAEAAAPASPSKEEVVPAEAVQAGEAPAADQPSSSAAGEQQQQQQQSEAAPAAEAQAAPKPAPAVPRPPRGALASVVASTIRDLYLGPPRGGRQSVDPSPLLHTLRGFPLAAELFDGGQHDCQELLHKLVDLLHEDLNEARLASAAQPSQQSAGEATSEVADQAAAATEEQADGVQPPGDSAVMHDATPAAELSNGIAASDAEPPLAAAPSPSAPLPPAMETAPESEGAKADRAWAECLQRDASPLSRLFMGQSQSSVTCSRCNGRFTMYEPFWNLSLPLAPKAGGSLAWLGLKPGGVLSIEDCLRLFAAEEKLAGEEAFHCGICKDRVTATKRLRLHRLPDAVALHIKRFHHKGTTMGKLTATVAFPPSGLDFTAYLSPEAPHGREEALYDLYAVSNHVGTLSGGHYTAYCRVQQADGTGAWHHFNDEVVTAVPQSQVVSPNAYILFYAKRKYRDVAAARAVLGAAPAGHTHSRSRSTGASFFHGMGPRKES